MARTKPNKTIDTHFTVRGNGAFPLDMLRYDQCFPDGQEPVSRLTDEHVIRDVRLVARSESGYITPARWASFGWHVVEINGQSTIGRVLPDQMCR